MQDKVFKLIEIVGTGESTDEAVKAAVARASKTLKGLDWVEVQEVRGLVKNGRISEFQVKLKVGFRVMEPAELAA